MFKESEIAMVHEWKYTCKNMKETQESTVNLSRQDDYMLELIDAKTPEGQKNGHFKQQIDHNMWVIGDLWGELDDFLYVYQKLC